MRSTRRPVGSDVAPDPTLGTSGATPATCGRTRAPARFWGSSPVRGDRGAVAGCRGRRTPTS
jgi:hypothetical protein